MTNLYKPRSSSFYNQCEFVRKGLSININKVSLHRLDGYLGNCYHSYIQVILNMIPA